MAVLGSVELFGRDLVVHVNSPARAVRAMAPLKDLRGEELLAPAVRVQSIAQMTEARDRREREETAISVEIATPLIHDLLDRRYRETLDRPVAMIGGVSPREAVRTAEGRERVDRVAEASGECIRQARSGGSDGELRLRLDVARTGDRGPTAMTVARAVDGPRCSKER